MVCRLHVYHVWDLQCMHHYLDHISAGKSWIAKYPQILITHVYE